MKIKNKILDIVIIVCTIFMFVGYISYLFKLLIWSEGVFPFAVAVFVCIFLPVVLLLGRAGVWSKLFRKAYPIVKAIYATGLCFYVVSFVFMCAYIYGSIVNEPNAKDLPEKTVFITLGAKVEYDGKPGKVLKKRLDTTYDLLNACPSALCIVSGSKGSDEPISEALCMFNYLTERGIDSSRIILEDKSTSTIENVKNSMELIKDEGMEDYSIAFVTTNFHVPRAKIIAGRLGVNNAYFFNAPDTSPFVLYTILVREYMSYCKLFLLGV